jgi:AcrR family transcriptional regulator
LQPLKNSNTVLKKIVDEMQIIEVAQKRFGAFGVNKTSMNDIADDLGISKASLYYYFPDKETLYKSVIEKEQNEFIERISEKLLRISEPEQLLKEYVRARLSYFRMLLNLGRLKFEEFAGIKPKIRNSIKSFREKEQQIVEKIIAKGEDEGIFSTGNPSKTASLFLDLIKGLRISVLNDKDTFFIEDSEFECLLEKTLAFTSIFIRGLRSNHN